MKKIALVLSILCMTAIESWSGNNSPQIPIVIIESSQEDGLNHRSPETTPISACYEDFISSVCMTFSQNLGVLDITITNLTDGTYADFEIDSSLGSAILPISGVEGFYTIVIVLANGVEYVGQFEL